MRARFPVGGSTVTDHAIWVGGGNAFSAAHAPCPDIDV